MNSVKEFLLKPFERIVSTCNQVVSGKYWWIFFIILIIFFGSIRFLKINADPNQDMTISASIYADEGFKTYSVRTKLLYGDWNWSPQDKYKGWHKANPVPAFLYTWWFKLFDASFASIRSLNILFSVLTMIALFFFVKRNYDIETAFVSLVLYGSSNYLVMFNRLGFLENFLSLFIIIVLFCVIEILKKRKSLLSTAAKKISSDSLSFVYITLLSIAGFFATLCAIYTKTSVMIIVIALIPFLTLYFFYSNKKLNRFFIHKFYISVGLIIIGYVLVAHFGWFEQFLKSIAKIKVFNIDLKFLLPLKQKTDNFDPIYLSIAKSMYLEFVYLQPFIFFTGIYYALTTYYEYVYEKKYSMLSTLLSTWFLFGFLFLSILKYHPSRYYQLMSIPIIILSARFIVTGFKKNITTLLYPNRKFSFRRIMISLFWFYLFFYIGLTILLNTLSFSFRKSVYNHVYSMILNNNLKSIIPIVIVLLVFQTGIITVCYTMLPKFRSLFVKKRFYHVILLLIILFQTYQFSKWLITSRYHLFNSSKKITSLVEKDAIIAGSWSAGLTVENNLRACVIQGSMKYNTDLLDDIISGKPVPYYQIKYGRKQKYVKSGVPAYLAIGLNQPSDSKIIKKYSKFLTPERKIYSVEFGLFDIEIYNLNQ